MTAPLDDSTTRDAVTAALGAEHAAIWCYGLASAFLPVDANTDADVAAHRARRDAVEALLEGAGEPVAPAAASYTTPAPVTDGLSAAALLVVAEDDVATAWRAVVERTDDPGLRRTGTDAVVAATRARVRWPRTVGVAPEVPPFPGC